MTSAPTTSSTISWATTAEARRQPLRLRLKPKAPVTGRVDGGWWPRSRDLAVELPGLLAVLAVRLGRIERVGYHPADWDPTVRRINMDGGVVRLAGYNSQRAHTVDVLAARQRLTLLVVPSQASIETAHAALMAAGHRGNTDDVEVLLAGRRAQPSRHGQLDNAEENAHQRWELDGGGLHEGL